MSDPIRLKIGGMTCNHCVTHVTKALAGVTGVDEVIEVDLDQGEARVAGVADVNELIAAVKQAGYDASETG